MRRTRTPKLIIKVKVYKHDKMDKGACISLRVFNKRVTYLYLKTAHAYLELDRVQLL